MTTPDCCCGCRGGCWPVVNGVLQNVPWEISAPNCPAIDGLTGVFEPLLPTGSYTDGECGPCVCYQSSAQLILPGTYHGESGGGPFPDPPAQCDEFACNVVLDLFIDSPGPGENCCKFKLVVILTEGLGLILSDASGRAHSGAQCVPYVEGIDATKVREYDLATCECLPDQAGFVGVFALSDIILECTFPAFSGACLGEDPCCAPCSLADATLSLG